MMSGKANREVVLEGVECLRKTFEDFIHKKQAEGYDFKFLDSQMIAHNFLKLVIYHITDEIMEQQNTPKAARPAISMHLMKIAIATLQRSLEKPITNENDITLS